MKIGRSSVPPPLPKSLKCSLLIVTFRYISFPLNFIVTVVSVDFLHFFFTRYIRYTCFRQIVSIKKSLRCLLLIVTVHCISFPLNFIVSVVSVEDVQYYSHSFHSLHLLQQFQADCAYKNISKGVYEN